MRHLLAGAAVAIVVGVGSTHPASAATSATLSLNPSTGVDPYTNRIAVTFSFDGPPCVDQERIDFSWDGAPWFSAYIDGGTCTANRKMAPPSLPPCADMCQYTVEGVEFGAPGISCATPCSASAIFTVNAPSPAPTPTPTDTPTLTPSPTLVPTPTGTTTPAPTTNPPTPLLVTAKRTTGPRSPSGTHGGAAPSTPTPTPSPTSGIAGSASGPDSQPPDPTADSGPAVDLIALCVFGGFVMLATGLWLYFRFNRRAQAQADA